MQISCFHSDVGLYCVKWHRNLLLLFQYWLHGFPALFTDTLLSISFYFFYFSSFYFSVPRGRLNCWLFRAHFKTASRTVSYTSHRSYHYFSSQPNHALIKLTGRDCLDKTGPTKKARCGNFHSFSTRRSPSIRAATARRTGAVVMTNWLSRTARKRQSTLIFAELLYRGAVQNGSPPHGKLHLHGHPQKGHDASVYVKCRLNTLRQVTLKENILFANAYRLSGYFDVPSVHSVDHVKIDRRQCCHWSSHRHR